MVYYQKKKNSLRGFILKTGDLWLPFGFFDVTKELYLYIVLQHKQLHGIWLGYFSLFSDENHMPVFVLALLLACCSLHPRTCLYLRTEGSSVLPYSSHLNTAVLVHKSRYVTSTWLQWSDFTQSSCLLFLKSKAAGGMGSILLDHWREQAGVSYPKLDRIPGQPLLCIKHHLLRPEGLFSGKPSAEQGWH